MNVYVLSGFVPFHLSSRKITPNNFLAMEALELMASRDPRIGFRTGFHEIDELVGNSLRFGELFEICGTRHSAKLRVGHSILANILCAYVDEPDSIRIVVFNYSNQFSTELLVRLMRERAELTVSFTFWS
jgi:hypothetical protein